MPQLVPAEEQEGELEYIACKVLTACIHRYGMSPDSKYQAALAAQCFDMAQAMIAERGRRGKS